MKNISLVFRAVLVGVFCVIGALAAVADDTTPQPVIARRAIICDIWQYSSEARTWGCIQLPREVSLASGTATEQVVQALQEQIRKLEERIKKLEESIPHSYWGN